MTSFIFEGRGLAVFLNRKKDCYLVKIAILFWRRERDSNPCPACTGYRISSADPSTTWVSLQLLRYYNEKHLKNQAPKPMLLFVGQMLPDLIDIPRADSQDNVTGLGCLSQDLFQFLKGWAEASSFNLLCQSC